MTIGTLVCYKAYPGDTVDLAIGVVMAVNNMGMVRVQWDDGFIDWYGPVALVKV